MMAKRPIAPGALVKIDRLHVLAWINLRLRGSLWGEKATTQRVAAEQQLILAAARKAASRNPHKVIAELAHALARARVAIHNEETRKAWLEAGR